MIIEQGQLHGLPAARDIYNALYKRVSVIGYCSGTWDLTHAGHLNFFRQCKDQCDALVVGVAGDAAVEQYKCRRPVIGQQHRLAMVDGLKPVDFCFLNEVGSVQGDFENIIKALRPHKYFYGPDSVGLEHRLAVCDTYKVESMLVERLPGISTSEIIEDVLNTLDIRYVD